MIPALNPLRTLQDAHEPECMCESCVDVMDSDELELHDADCECSECAYDRACDQADTYNDSVA